MGAPRIYLASSSPRRRDLLQQLAIDFSVYSLSLLAERPSKVCLIGYSSSLPGGANGTQLSSVACLIRLPTRASPPKRAP